jgi:hypothetical protein
MLTSRRAMAACDSDTLEHVQALLSVCVYRAFNVLKQIKKRLIFDECSQTHRVCIFNHCFKKTPHRCGGLRVSNVSAKYDYDRDVPAKAANILKIKSSVVVISRRRHRHISLVSSGILACTESGAE